MARLSDPVLPRRAESSSVEWIHFFAVSKSFATAGSMRRVVLRPTTVSLPADRRVAILGARQSGKTTVLQLLARKLSPDQGDIAGISATSPVVNSTGLLHPQLSGLENIRFLARAYGIGADQLSDAVSAFSGLRPPRDLPLRAQDAASRKMLEAAIIIVLPFACYLFDEAGQLQPDLLDRCMEAASQRNAGFIFSTSQAGLVRRLADWVLVIDDATLHPFSAVQDAVQFFERKGKHER